MVNQKETLLVNEKVKFADLILSNEANEYIKKIWSNYTPEDISSNSYLHLPKQIEEFNLEIKTGNNYNFDLSF